MTELEVGGTVAGYRIKEVLGRGGMGIVYWAIDDRLGRNVAVKVIAPEQASDPAFRSRFIRESRAAAAIDHPNVLPIYEAGEEDGVLFLAARLVDGDDLRELLRREEPLEPGRALALVAQVAAALDAAHAQGLIHRDVKPGNVLVRRDPGPGSEHCYLTDFGLAKQVDSRSGLTATGQFVGTLDYVAPEQIQGKPVDGRADVYALAALFCECVTGAPPFARDSQAALLYAHLSDPPPTIAARVDGAPKALDDVIARAMAKAPEDRFATCSEFVESARAAFAESAPQRAPSTLVPDAAPETEVAATRKAEGGAPARSTTEVARPAGTAPGRRLPSRRALLAGALAAGALLLGGVLWAVLGSGGGGNDGGGGLTDAIELSSQTAALARAVGTDTGRLAQKVGQGADTTGLAGAFDRYKRRAEDLGASVGRTLSSGDPGRSELEAAARSLDQTSIRLASAADDPFASGAVKGAQAAKRSMAEALASLEDALAAVQRAFRDQGSNGAAASVRDSLDQLHSNRQQLTAVFDTLIRALRNPG